MKKKLLDLLAKKNARKAEIVAKAEKTESVEELRNPNAELDTLNEEIRSLQEMIDSMDDEGEEKEKDRKRGQRLSTARFPAWLKLRLKPARKKTKNRWNTAKHSSSL